MQEAYDRELIAQLLSAAKTAGSPTETRPAVACGQIRSTCINFEAILSHRHSRRGFVELQHELAIRLI